MREKLSDFTSVPRSRWLGYCPGIVPTLTLHAPGPGMSDWFVSRFLALSIRLSSSLSSKLSQPIPKEEADSVCRLSEALWYGYEYDTGHGRRHRAGTYSLKSDHHLSVERLSRVVPGRGASSRLNQRQRNVSSISRRSFRCSLLHALAAPWWYGHASAPEQSL